MWNLDIRQSFTRFRYLLRIVPLIALLVAVGPACIPTLLFTLDNPSPDGSNGLGPGAAVGDVNGDGRDDIVVGAFYWGGDVQEGRVYVFSGADGSLLFTLTTPNPQAGGANFGLDVAVGDVDGDGRDDIAVSACGQDVGGNRNQGQAYVFSGANGSLLFTLDTPNPRRGLLFGHSLAMGDVDGDGRDDVVVGAPNFGAREQGRVYVFSGASGSLLFTLDSPDPQPEQYFGELLAVGDLNGDGKRDIAVRSSRLLGGGSAVYLFSGASGSLLFTLESPRPPLPPYPCWDCGMEIFGASLAMGDVDGDGRDDVVVGTPWHSVAGNGGQGQGRAYVFSGAGGSLLLALESPSPQFAVGFGGLVAAGDVNGDGRADIVVGAGPEYGGHRLVFYVFSGASGSLLLVIPNPNPQQDAGLVKALTVGDVNGDGMADMALVVGGRVYVYSSVPASVAAAVGSFAIPR